MAGTDQRERLEQAGRAGKGDQREQIERVGQGMRVEQTDRPREGMRLEQKDQLDQGEQTNQTDRPGQGMRVEQAERQGQGEQKDQPDQPDQSEQKAKEEEHRDERIEKTGQLTLNKNPQKHNIHLLTIIGEVEGHDNLSGNAKTTKYEHILPQLAAIEDSSEVQGVLVLLNTMGGDVEAGLAIAEMLASLSKPTVSLVLGGSHSIGVPIAVSTCYSFVVPTGTMVIHPVRMNGMVIGVPQTFDYFKQIQDRITGFVCGHCRITREKFEDLMMETGMLTKDVGTILVGEEAVDCGIIDEVGGIDRAVKKLHQLIEEKQEQSGQTTTDQR